MTHTVSKAEVKSIWASYGNVIHLGGQDINYQREVVRREVVTNEIKVPKARWTFVYKKFGRIEVPVNLIVQVIIDVARPHDLKPNDKVELQIETVFTEVDSDGQPVLAQGEDEYTANWNMIFELLFMRQSDVIRTLGVTTCIALLGIIWGYYVLPFDAE
jgi:hypothetical protein